jgi:hypothetical protein
MTRTSLENEIENLNEDEEAPSGRMVVNSEFKSM